jgi:hypothetical protein
MTDETGEIVAGQLRLGADGGISRGQPGYGSNLPWSRRRRAGVYAGAVGVRYW